MAVARGEPDWAAAVILAFIYLRALFNEKGNSLGLAACRRVMQRGALFGIFAVDVGLVCQKKFDALYMPAHRSERYRSTPECIGDGGVEWIFIEQPLQSFGIAVEGRGHWIELRSLALEPVGDPVMFVFQGRCQRRLRHGIAGIDIRPGRNQCLDRFHVTFLSGKMEWGATIVINDVDRGFR